MNQGFAIGFAIHHLANKINNLRSAKVCNDCGPPPPPAFPHKINPLRHASRPCVAERFPTLIAEQFPALQQKKGERAAQKGGQPAALTNASIALSEASSAPKSFSGTMFGPSDGA